MYIFQNICITYVYCNTSNILHSLKTGYYKYDIFYLDTRLLQFTLPSSALKGIITILIILNFNVTDGDTDICMYVYFKSSIYEFLNYFAFE